MTTQVDLIGDLQKRYPDAFNGQHTSMFTFDCGEGWLDVVGTLCFLLAEANRREGKAPTFLLSVTEKFGTLRVMVSSREPEARQLIAFAEHHSTRVCEICGARARLLYSDGWQRTRCDAHSLTVRTTEDD
jgi:hypothetical protein